MLPLIVIGHLSGLFAGPYHVISPFDQNDLASFIHQTGG
jgi:hypothetical protein